MSWVLVVDDDRGSRTSDRGAPGHQPSADERPGEAAAHPRVRSRGGGYHGVRPLRQGDCEAAMGLGALAYLTKPVDLRALSVAWRTHRTQVTQ